MKEANKKLVEGEVDKGIDQTRFFWKGSVYEGMEVLRQLLDVGMMCWQRG